jgi:hypothetical protein
VLSTDEDVLAVHVLANDPRSWPTEGLIVVAPAEHMTLADLEAIPRQLRDECGWGFGYEQDVSKVGGGIGADGATVLGLVLGVIGAVPTVDSLLHRLRRQVPPCPEREEAWDTATWAVALQYRAVDRKELRLLKEARNRDHWVFTLALPCTGDEFEVEAYGSRSTAIATRVVWTNGDPWGRGPGVVDPR